MTRFDEALHSTYAVAAGVLAASSPPTTLDQSPNSPSAWTCDMRRPAGLACTTYQHRSLGRGRLRVLLPPNELQVEQTDPRSSLQALHPSTGGTGQSAGSGTEGTVLPSFLTWDAYSRPSSLGPRAVLGLAANKWPMSGLQRARSLWLYHDMLSLCAICWLQRFTAWAL